MNRALIRPHAVRKLRLLTGHLAWAGWLLVSWASPALAESGLAPGAAPPGATVAIAGQGFGPFKSTRENRVLFNGLPALIQRWDADLIAVKVPLRATSGPVTVVSGKKTIAVGRFTVQQPTIRSLTPAEAEPGAVLQVAGEHFGTTAGSRDPNTMFGVNDVLVGGATAKIRRWRDDKIEVEVPGIAVSGEVVVRLASSDPLPDGSCCAQVEYSISNAAPFKVIPAIRADPLSGPIGTKVVLFGKGFGNKAAGDQLLFNGRPGVIAQWTDTLIVTHVPLDAVSGPLVLKQGETQRTVGTFSVPTPKATGLSVSSGPIGTLLRITGENFGFYSESGSTPFAFTDFNKGENVVEIGGVPAVVYRWHDDKIDVWVPFSAKSGPVVVKRGGTKPKADGSCCAERGLITRDAGRFTVTTPTVASYTPTSAGLDEIVTIKGSGFGTFLKTAEQTQPGLNEAGHDFVPYEFGENVARTEVLFSNVAGIVVSWTDTEIKVQVPRRHLYGVGKKNEFHPDLSTGPLVVRRGSWDLKPDGYCCTTKQWVTAEAGTFTILARGLPDQSNFTDTRPEASTVP
ncbi:MAG: IPT/TIG domain-containing protein [Nitrospiraceae bacterium]